jgi:DNA-binding transcriptional regulator YiaG
MEPISREDLAEYIKNMRQTLGMNMTQFSKLTGISTQTLTKWERQEVYPKNIQASINKIRQSVRVEIERRRREEA